MFRSLRARLILSHTLLLLLVIPLLGIVLTYVLEVRVVLVNVARQLAGQAVLVAELARAEPEALADPARAQAFVNRISPLFPANLMLLDADGVALATSDPRYQGSLGRRLALPGLAAARAGQTTSQVEYTREAQQEIADVMAPVFDRPGGRLLGIVRLSDEFGSTFERFRTLRVLIAEVLGVGLLLGTVTALLMADRLARPLGRVSDAVESLARGRRPAPLAETGPSEVQRLIRGFNTLAGRLNQLEEARERLLANLVHELGRPLGAMRAATYALLSGAEQEPGLRRELIGGIDGEIRRLQRLVEDLGEMEEQLLGRVSLDREPVSLAGWLAETLSPWREAAGQKGLAWQADLAPALPTVEIDPGRLAQALGNLLSNAVKYTPPGGQVTVMACQEGSDLLIAVQDSGPGIAAEEQAKVFKPFYRERGGQRYAQGMGIGLSIAADLVAAHGGTIALQSAPGRGSRFTIRLPIPSPS